MYLEKFKLAGKSAVVTGAAQGIGYACAEALCQAGARVVLTDIDFEKCNSAANELAGRGYDVSPMRLDVTDTKEVESIATLLVAGKRQVDILVCNAGVAEKSTGAEHLSDGSWQRMLDVNLTGVFKCCRAFGTRMLAQGGGSIVNIGSMSGSIVNRPQAQCHYNAAKAGVHHLTRSLAVEWAPFGLRVNAVAPTYIDTPLLNFAKEDHTVIDEWIRHTPMARLGRPDEIASVALFLVSDAASLLTGSIIEADGGYTCW